MDLDVARSAVAIGMLAGGAVLDLKHRRVPNRYWYPFAAVAALFVVAELATSAPDDRRATLLFDAVAAVLCGFFYLIWRLGLFGGADAKALMVLAVLEPRTVAGGLPVPAALVTLMLGSVAMLLVPVVFLAWNLAHGHSRMPAALLGVPMELQQAKASKVWPMQQADADGKVRFRYWIRLRGDLDAQYAGLEQAGVTTVWTTPKVPFFLPLLLGAVAWLWVRHMPFPAI